MSEHVHWLLELDVRDGQLDTLKALMGEMVESTRADEPGTLNYEWFVSDDGAVCHLYERYENSDAALVHLQTFGARFAQRFLAALKPTRIVIYGPANDDVRKALEPLGAVHMAQIGGFAR